MRSDGPNAAKKRRGVLLVSLPPIGISREQAAAFIGISTSLFDKAVGISMPHPRVLGGRLIWDVDELVDAFKRLPHRGEWELETIETHNPWNE